MNVIYIQDQEIYKNGNDFYHEKSVHFFTRYLSGLKDEEQLNVYCGIIDCEEKDRIKRYQKINDRRIKYVRIPEFRDITKISLTRQIIKDAVRNADFVYLRCGVAASIGAFYCKRYKIPYMAIVNEDIYKNCIVSSKRIVRLAAAPLWVGSRFLVKNAKYACYVTREYLEKRYPSSGMIIGCSDVETLELDTGVLDKRLAKISQSSSKTCVIGIAGSLKAFLKAHDVAIKALKFLNILSDKHFIMEIVGTGSSERLKKLAIKEKVIDQVFFLGELKHNDVLKWMDNIDIYVHPSRSEGLPRTIIEAMSRALPCVCSDVGGIPELIDNKWLFSYKGNKKPEVDLAKQIINMTIDNMDQQARINFDKAQGYNPEVLNGRRNTFFSEAISKERGGSDA